MKKPIDTGLSYVAMSFLYWLIASLTFPVLTIHLLEQDINYLDLGLIVSFTTFAYVFLDIPIGFMGDFFRKKYIFMLGMVFHAVGYFLWSISSSVVMVVVAYTCWNIGRSFFSGILESWYVNTVQHRYRAKKINRTFNIASMGTAFCIGLGVLITGQVLNLNKQEGILSIIDAALILQLAAILILCLAGLAFFLMNDDYANGERSSRINFYRVQEIINCLKSPNFARFLPLSFSYGFAFGFFEIFWMPIGIASGFEDFKVSIAYSSAYFCSTLVLLILLKFSNRTQNYNFWIPWLRIFFGICFLAMSLASSFAAFCMSMIVIYVISFIEYPLIQTAIHQSILDKYRNIMISIESVVKQGAGIISGGIGGWIYQDYGVQAALMATAFIICLSVLAYLSIKTLADTR